MQQQRPPGHSTARHARRVRRSRLRLWYWLAALAVAGGVVLTFTARPGYRAVKTMRARSLAKSALTCLQRNDEAGATGSLEIALRLAPLDPTVVRAAVALERRHDRPATVDLLVRLIHSGTASPDERRACVGAALQHGRLDVARTHLGELLEESPKELRNRLLRLRYLEVAGHAEQARAESRRLLRDHPDDRGIQRAAGEALLRGWKPEDRSLGRSLLMALALGGEPECRPAWAALSADPELPRPDADVLVRRIREAGGKDPSSLRLLLRLRLRIAREEELAVVDDVLSAMGGSSNTEALVQLCAWLADLGRYAAVEHAIPAERASGDARLRTQRLEALVEQAKWPQLEDEVRGAGSRLDPVLGRCARARLAAHLGRSPEAAALLGEAVDLAASRADRLRYVARQAVVAGFPEIGIDAHRRLLKSPRHSLDAARDILRLLESRDELRRNLQVIEQLAEQMPGDSGVQLERCYLRLLVHGDGEKVRSLLEGMDKNQHSLPEFMAVRAFTELLSGNPEEALALVDKLEPGWFGTAPRWQLIAALVRRANRQNGAAWEIARHIDKRSLKSEERLLLRGMFETGDDTPAEADKPGTRAGQPKTGALTPSP